MLYKPGNSIFKRECFLVLFLPRPLPLGKLEAYIENQAFDKFQPTFFATGKGKKPRGHILTGRRESSGRRRIDLSNGY